MDSKTHDITAQLVQLKYPSPPDMPLKTGIPTDPSKIYNNTDNIHDFIPKIVTTKPIANVCPVIGTGENGSGIVTCASTAIIAAPIAANTY